MRSRRGGRSWGGGGLSRADGFAWLQRLISAAGTPGFGSYETRDWVTRGTPLPGDELTALLERADAIRGRLLAWLRGVDLIVCPAMPQPAIRHGESSAAWFGDTYSDVHNLTGWPAAVVRGGTSPEGLPIGIQVVAPPWRGDLALAGAQGIEAPPGRGRRVVRHVRTDREDDDFTVCPSVRKKLAEPATGLDRSRPGSGGDRKRNDP